MVESMLIGAELAEKQLIVLRYRDLQQLCGLFQQLFGDADEVIVSSSGSFCLVADEIDGKPVGGKAPELIDTLQKYLVKEFIDATTV